MQVENLSFSYEKGQTPFFDNFSFHLEEGLIHSLNGKNGVGKSLLLQILSQRFEKRAVLMDQRYDKIVADKFNAFENIQFSHFKRFPSLFTRPSFLQKDLFKEFRIDPTLAVEKLSGGQRQILAFAMKLHKEAEFLLLDEPTAALDEENAQVVFEFLKGLKNVTILMVCHDSEIVAKYTTGRRLHLFIDKEGVRRLE